MCAAGRHGAAEELRALSDRLKAPLVLSPSREQPGPLALTASIRLSGAVPGFAFYRRRFFPSTAQHCAALAPAASMAAAVPVSARGDDGATKIAGMPYD